MVLSYQMGALHIGRLSADSSVSTSIHTGSLAVNGLDMTYKLTESVNVKDLGAKGDGVTDDTIAIQRAINQVGTSGGTVYFGPYTYRVTSTILISSSNVRLEGLGTLTTLKLDWTNTGFILPLMIVTVSATGAQLNGISFDHNALSAPQASLSSSLALAYLNCVLVMANDTTVTNCSVHNSWDNGFGVGAFSITGTGTVGNPFTMNFGNISVGNPQRVFFENCRAYNCGIGVHTSGPSGQVGGGFNNLNGSRVQFTNCMAYNCATGFIADFGANAETSFTGCIAVSSAYTTGWGFWIGCSPCILTGCKALYCQKDGFVIAYQSNGTVLSGCYSFANGANGFLLGGSKMTLTGCMAQANSQSPINSSSGFLLDSSSAALSALVMVGCVALAESAQQYGLNARGGNTITAIWIGGILDGVTGDFNVGSYNILITGQKPLTRNYGVGVDDPVGKFEILGDVNSYLGTAVGDNGNEGVLALSSSTTRSKRLAMGYDSANDLSVIQSVYAGVMKKPLAINPSGGNVVLSIGSWNNGHILLGTYHMWVDAIGSLRIKSGAPVSDTDGVTVGSQT